MSSPQETVGGLANEGKTGGIILLSELPSRLSSELNCNDFTHAKHRSPTAGKPITKYQFCHPIYLRHSPRIINSHLGGTSSRSKNLPGELNQVKKEKFIMISDKLFCLFNVVIL